MVTVPFQTSAPVAILKLVSLVESSKKLRYLAIFSESVS